MLARLTIPVRLYLGFAVMTAALMFLAWSSHLGSLTAESGLSGFKRSTERRVAVLKLRADVLDLQRLVQVYSYTGHRTLGERAKTQIRTLASRLELLQTEATTKEVTTLFGRLEAHIANYERGLGFAVEERSLRDQLVNERVPALELEIEKLRRESDLMEPAIDTTFLLIQLNLRRYLVDPDFALVRESSERASAVLSADSVVPRVRDLMEEYERTFVRIVQATRGYLFLVSVVLAGEAMEFTHTVNALSRVSRERVQVIASEVQTGGRTIRQLNLWGSVLAVLLGVGLALVIGRGISRPLASITATLARLGVGEQGVAVPFIHRRDEIGVMAKAANVFRQKNEQTELLLSEARELGRNLDEHKRQLERSNEELEQFVHTVSHDLKSPLVTSMGFLGIMRQLSDTGNHEDACKKIGKLEKAHRRMNQLISDLLDLSRVGRSDKTRDVVALKPLVSELGDDLERVNPGVTIKVQNLPSILGNESRVLQVFENLLTNAVKYGGASVKVEVGGAVEADRVICFVRDDGPGIAPEHHGIIFGLFQRLGNDTEGTGVGLAVVRRVMASHGGTIRVESKGDGTGTTFWLDFPAVVDP